MKEQPTGTRIPELWRMAALMKMCPKEIKKMIDLSWDTIDEKFTVMRDKMMTWAMNKAEEIGGAVSMDVGGVDGDWNDDGWRWTRCTQRRDVTIVKVMGTWRENALVRVRARET